MLLILLFVGEITGSLHAGRGRAKPAHGDFAAGQQRDGAPGETAHPRGIRRRSLPVSNTV